MRYLVLSLIMWVLAASVAQAQSPTPTPAPSGYTFAGYDFESGSTVDISDRLNVFNQPAFINPTGSTAVTMWNMVNATNAIGIFVILLLGLRVVWWIYGKVTASEPPTAKLSDVSDDIAYIRRSNPFRRSRK